MRNQLKSWQRLEEHQREMIGADMRDMFAADGGRAQAFSLEWGDIVCDFSRNIVDATTMKLLLELARECRLQQRIEEMFSGVPVNVTEGRAALHTALRCRDKLAVITVDGVDVMPQVRATLEQMRGLVNALRSGTWRGHSGAPINTVVNIGIGGSDLGPRLVTRALEHCMGAGAVRTEFVSTIDPVALQRLLARLDPATTLFIISSKSFTTRETMLNAAAARAWLCSAMGEAAVARHFVAVSANCEAVAEFGISADNRFAMWDWVGGRYSLWSAIGLPIAIAHGMEVFEQLLDGAYAMDCHFRTAPLEQNMPVLLALIGVWYNNFFYRDSYALLIYDNALRLLPDWLQQLDMESNGKSCTCSGHGIGYPTAPVVWGHIGIEGQHAFYQRLHQSPVFVPCDFICAASVGDNHYPQQQRFLLANCLAQAEALLKGRDGATVRSELRTAGMDETKIAALLPHRIFSGNRPSNTIIYNKLTPHTLGALLALYEHRTFVQGVIWDVNSFDQWGVELGKQLAGTIDMELSDEQISGHDPSTTALLRRCIDWQQG